MRSVNLQIDDYGALVRVGVCITRASKQALMRAGRDVPPTQEVLLLVDTGASHTIVDAAVMRSLQLQPTNVYRYHTTSTKGVPDECEAYPVDLTLGRRTDLNLLQIGPIEVMANQFIGHHYQGLLGRDVLNRIQMSWRGLTRTATLEYP